MRPGGAEAPVLRVKKGVEVYDDSLSDSDLGPAARNAIRGRPRPGRSSRSPARRGRSSFILLLILAVALLVVIRFVPRAPADRATIAGWDVVLRAMPYGEALIVSLTFVQPAGGQGAPDASVRILLPDTGDRLSLSGSLEKSPITLRGQLPYTTRVRKVRAEVTVATETKTLLLAARGSP